MSLSTQNTHTNPLATHNIPRRQNKPRDGVRQRSIRSIIASDSSNSKIIYVYCSPKLKNALTCILRFIVVAYCITVPLFVYLLHKESSDNIEKLNKLERRLSGHLKKRPAMGETSKNRVRRSYVSTEGNRSLQIGRSHFLKNYKDLTKLKKKMNRDIEKLNKTVIAYGNRMKPMKSAERWINNVYINYVLPNITDIAPKKCNCKKKPSTTKNPSTMPGSVFLTSPKDKSLETPALNLSTTYIHWGSASCKDSKRNVVYKGYMSGALPRPGPSSMKQGGGVNYLCLPNQPKYGKFASGRSERRTYIDGVIYGESFKNIDNLANRVIPCSVCESTGKTATVMIPGSNVCQPNWSLEYIGFIATDGKESQRTEYVCLDKTSKNAKYVNHKRNSIGSLDTVAVKCMKDILPCGGTNQYKEDTILPCVVCSR